MPCAGRTIASATEERAQHVRSAVQHLEPAFRHPKAETDFQVVFAPRWDGGATTPQVEPTCVRAAWALVNIFLLARMAGERTGLAGAEKWFYGRHRLPSLTAYVRDPEMVVNILSRVEYDDNLLDLLPYVLERHGPGSRISVMKDPQTMVARQAKREGGIFYTPADVADYMVDEAVAGRSADIRFLDPSCGNGVYLVARLRMQQEDRLAFALRCLYGCDISTLAVESCAFVLLHHCLPVHNAWSAWHALRLNLAATDTLRFAAVAGDEGRYARAAETREGIREQLSKGRLVKARRDNQPADGGPQLSLFSDDHLVPVGAVFSEAEGGFEVLAGNPPYASIGERADRALLDRQYASLREGNGSADLYPPFIEMMWRLTRPGNNTSTLVVPLSIAYQQGGQFTACRQAMTAKGGRWRFAFFDRQPHALFGEDVKTRNAILFRSELPDDPPRACSATMCTGPLRKWTSRTRDKLFDSISFTVLHGVSIVDGIPKLSGDEQSHAFTVLSARKDRLLSLCTRARTCLPHEATVNSDHPRVFVASTAYNFLNVFHSITVDKRYQLSENTIHCLEFADQATASMALAILSSRLTYWLWHVVGDGFHVGAWFIQNLPFGRSSFTSWQAADLQECGEDLWKALQAHRIVSLNKGKQTVAYRPLALEKKRDAIDDLLIDAAKLPHRFKQTLKQFVKDAVVVDDTDTRRCHLLALFDFQEGKP